MTADDDGVPDDGVPDDAPVVPARITMALDLRELYGPQVDDQVGTYEGNPEGDVDAWELGEAVPKRWQVELLAELTGQPVRWWRGSLASSRAARV